MSEPLSAATLTAIEARAEGATPGVWSHWNPNSGTSHISVAGKVAWESLDSSARYADDERIPHWADANFISHARTDIPLLLAEVHRLRGLEAAVRSWAESHRIASGTGFDCVQAVEVSNLLDGKGAPNV